MNFVKAFNRYAGLGFLLATLAGCHNDGSPQVAKNHAEDFAPDDDTRATRRIIDSQAVAGARADMTLYEAHFDGAGLSSLGTHKLDQVLHSTGSMTPLVVYISVSDDKYALDHRSAITNYLADRGGLKPEQIKFENGPDPDTYMPSKQGLDDLAKQDSSASSGGAAPAAGGASH
jgi:hypothetical protein